MDLIEGKATARLDPPQGKTYPFYAVVCSLGRSGSTLFYESLTRHLIPSGHADYSFVRNLQDFDFKRGYCYKSHDRAPQFLPPGARVVFLFSNPLHIVLSLLRCERAWGEEGMRFHFHNMKADYSRKNDWLSRDVLGLEAIFDSYTRGPRNYALAAVRYETMWDREREIAEFLGLPGFRLAARKRRGALEDEAAAAVSVKARILGAYASLVRKVGSADDLKIWRDS